MDGISIIVPIYNEEDNVVESYQELTEVMAETGWNYELLFVDDGSRDATLKNLLAVSSTDAHVRIIEFRRNFGQQWLQGLSTAATRLWPPSMVFAK